MNTKKEIHDGFDILYQAMIRTLESPNVMDSNLENANVVDVLNRLAKGAFRISESICPPVTPESIGRDASGGCVASLTESVMGLTAGMFEIANSINSLADAVREIQDTSESC